MYKNSMYFTCTKQEFPTIDMWLAEQEYNYPPNVGTIMLDVKDDDVYHYTSEYHFKKWRYVTA